MPPKEILGQPYSFESSSARVVLPESGVPDITMLA
jgi:hypothetical protein